MNFYYRSWSSPIKLMMLCSLLAAGAVQAQDYRSMGITDVVGSADRRLQRGDYEGAIPALEEVIRRTERLEDPQSKETVQTCRFQLARSYFQTGRIPDGMEVLDVYIQNEPRKQERMALRMMAQGFFETEDWEKIEQVANQLLALPDLEPEDILNGNLLLGQSLFRQEKWGGCVKPLSYVANRTDEQRIKSLCEIMIVRALVEAKNWDELFVWIPRLYRTDAKYDITMNLTLMKAGKAQFEEVGNNTRALMLYRLVLPPEQLQAFAQERINRMSRELAQDKRRGITQAEADERQGDIDKIKESLETLKGLPPYEEEVDFRIGQIYYEVKRFWEGFVLFDQLYKEDRTSDIGEAAMLQSVLILYEEDVNDVVRAEERIIEYLEERPDGQYARTLLSMMIRDNLVKQNFDKVISLIPYLANLAPTSDADELSIQADLHYMIAFAYFQRRDYALAGEQFTVILDNYPESTHFADSRYFRGMTYMLQGQYKNAMADFKVYQNNHPEGDNYPPSVFREAVCYFGMAGEEQDKEAAAELITQSEKTFTRFIDNYPDSDLVSEAYSMRGDIEAAKEATDEDPHTLDRALSDYRKAIDKAQTSLQASYPAFQAAKVYKLEYKWQEIIDLMNYYMDRWGEMADVAEAVYWIGQSQIELEQVQEAVSAYIASIKRFGNDATQLGVDKIIVELINIADHYLSEEDRDGLSVKIKLVLAQVDPDDQVLRLRLEVTQAMLEGEDQAAALGARLLQEKQNLATVSPVGLALMCDAAVATGDTEQMQFLFDYFVANFEESDLLWHAYRAKTYKLLSEEDYWGVLATVDEAQGQFGAESYMGWAQIIKADTQYKMKKFDEAEESYNMVMGVPEWRGPLYAEAIYGMGMCKKELGEFATAHSFFQRTYLLFKSYDDGKWAARGYLAAADCLIKMGKEQEAVTTLQEMLQDDYTKDNPLADQVREQLKKLGVQS